MTTDADGATPRRTAAWGALTALLLLAACSGSSDDSGAAATASTSDVAAAPTASTVEVSPGTPTTNPPGATSPTAPAVVELPDPVSVLQQALAGADVGYHFETEVLVGDSVALTATGDHVGDSTRLTVTSDDQTVDYVITPDGSWAGQGGVWQELAQDAPATEPLQALAAPTSVEVSDYDGHHATLTGTYPAAALGLAGDQPVSVVIDVVDGVLVGLSYTAPGDGPPSQVHTSVTPLVDTTPVTVPTI